MCACIEGVMLCLMTPKTACSTVKAGRVNGGGGLDRKQTKNKKSYCIGSCVKPFRNKECALGTWVMMD